MPHLNPGLSKKPVILDISNFISIKMNTKDWTTKVMLIFLMFASLILVSFWGQVTHSQKSIFNQSGEKAQNLFTSPMKTYIIPRYKTTKAFNKYKPPHENIAIDPSNYGERYTKDIHGLPVNHQPIIVIHETSYSASSAINFFQTPNQDEKVQASYHALIKLDGTVVYLVPSEKRAFGAGNSVFEGDYGAETVQTNPNLPPSVNNFAYHVSLETPADSWGDDKNETHSSYTQLQYNSLAWLIAQSQIPDRRITTHRLVDRSGRKLDPINFDFNRFFNFLHLYRQIVQINPLIK